MGKNLIKKYKECLGDVNAKGKDTYAYEASGNKIDLKSYIVSDFYLTEDIVFDKILIYFSDILEDRAVLGMDILSLFNHSYRLEKNQLIGTYWIQDYESSMARYAVQRRNVGFYHPREIIIVF